MAYPSPGKRLIKKRFPRRILGIRAEMSGSSGRDVTNKGEKQNG